MVRFGNYSHSSRTFLKHKMKQSWKFTKRKGMRYQLYYVNYMGLWLIMDTYCKVEIIRMIHALERVENNLILK